ncbi:hypothetical protein BGK46_06165 [Salinivibrio sp. SS2]|nr:hypothetical protein BGK46_06165 [Salinivibrio sp. DV]
MAVVFALVGVVFDVFKSYSPTLATKVVNKNQPTALLLCVLSLALICVSGAASVFSLQSGIDSILSESKAAKVAQLKVDSIQSEINGLEELRSTQLSINHVSKANSTTLLISQKTAELNAAIDASANATDNSLLANFSTELVYIIALGIELISVAVTMVLFQLNAQTQTSNNIKQDETQLPSTPVATGFEAQTQPVLTQVETPLPEVTFVAATTREQVLENMKTAFLSGAVQPKYRAVWDAFKGQIKQKEIKQYLSELADRQILQRLDNGSYVLATA